MKHFLLTLPLAGALLLTSACTDRQQARADRTAENAGRNMDNAATTASVKSKLAGDVRLSTLTSINVDSNGSTVTLTGSVPTAEDKANAERVARTVDGVTRVVNNLTVNP
jgi:osmotically-inducible protein OsmY